jgi:hypothetical protein
MILFYLEKFFHFACEKVTKTSHILMKRVTYTSFKKLQSWWELIINDEFFTCIHGCKGSEKINI